MCRLDVYAYVHMLVMMHVPANMYANLRLHVHVDVYSCFIWIRYCLYLKSFLAQSDFRVLCVLAVICECFCLFVMWSASIQCVYRLWLNALPVLLLGLRLLWFGAVRSVIESFLSVMVRCVLCGSVHGQLSKSRCQIRCLVLMSIGMYSESHFWSGIAEFDFQVGAKSSLSWW